MILTEAQKAERRRLRDDFAYWASKCYTILDKDGNLGKLQINDAQKHILKAIDKQRNAGLPVRLLILKGRQQGASTLIEAWQLWRTTQGRGKRAFVLAHVAESASALFDQAKRGYDNLPPEMKPEQKRSNKKELVFGILDSSLEVTTAGGRGIGRGKTFLYGHASEVAFWPAGSAETNWNGLSQCIPPSPESALFAESTANGMGGLFHRLWTDAVRGLNEFEAVFVPWFWQPEYRMEVPEGFKRTPEEEEISRKFGLDNEQLQWRRQKIGASGRDLFNQEYPNTPEDAFLTSGRPVFDPAHIYRLIDKVEQPVRQMALMDAYDRQSGVSEATWEDNARGELHVFEEPKDFDSYYIGADVAEGIKGGDLSVAHVLNGKREQVAVWRGHIYPDAFASVLYHLGDLYNEAIIAVELNNHGILTANVLAKDLNYKEVWTDRVYDKINDRETVRLGFTQTAKSKPMILNKLRAEVRDDTIRIRDEVTLKEMLSFVVTENGSMEAEAGAHDDHVMSLAIANHINEGEWQPIANDESWYGEAH